MKGEKKKKHSEEKPTKPFYKVLTKGKQEKESNNDDEITGPFEVVHQVR
jgi:hypothetical protein